MANNNLIFGLKSSIVRFFHKVMLFAILHSTFIAPAQNIFIDYYYLKTSLKTRGLDGNKPYNEEIEKENDFLKDKNESINSSKNINTVNSSKRNYIKSIEDENLFFIDADIKEGFIGITKSNPLDNPSDNIFKFFINNFPNQNKRVYLTYDLYGVSSKNDVSKSINDRQTTGGYLVKIQQGWSTQKEEININWLNQGENRIQFSTPKNADYQYHIKNVKLEFENIKSDSNPSLLVLNDLDIHLEKNNKVYIKGFIREKKSNDLKVFAEEQLIDCTDGEFEGIFDLSQIVKNRGFIVIKAVDDKGLLGQEIITINSLLEADKIFSLVKPFEKKSLLFKANNTGILQIDGAKLILNDSATLINDKILSINKLRNIDIAPMGSGMINVTKDELAFRFLPDGTKFNKPVKIALEYDEKLIPKGYSPNDIKTFYFSNESKSWVALERDSLNEKEKTVISSTIHFSDYINGIIQTPESPETAGFTPTMMNDIKAVDPSSEMTIISPPEVSQKGDASVSYPIKIPSGRNGIQPQLAIQYSNEGGNGWLGQGWNINTPAISIDTRWGTPLLDPVNESEVYTLNGEQLMYENIENLEGDMVNWMPNRHYDADSGNTSIFSTVQRPRITNAVFTPRKQGSFAKIERLGTNPTNYYWKVTNTDGTINWYGGNENGVEINAVIKSGHGEIVHWGLYMVEDVFRNTIKYVYDNSIISGQTGVNQNLNDGIVFHVKGIYYTGLGDQDYGYQINFANKTNYREDISINGRLGLKQVEPFFLDNITVKQTNSAEIIRKYKFDLGYGKFKKGRLESVSELDKNDNVFYTHTFEYYDDLDQDGTDVYFSSGINQTICNDAPPPCEDNDGDGVCNDVDACVDIFGPASNNGCPESNNCYEIIVPIPLINKLYSYNYTFIHDVNDYCEFTPYRIKDVSFGNSTLTPSQPIYMSYFNPNTNTLENYCNTMPTNSDKSNPNFNNQFATWLNNNFLSGLNVFDLGVISSATYGIAQNGPHNRTELFVGFKSYNDSYTGSINLEYSSNNSGNYTPAIFPFSPPNTFSKSVYSATGLPSQISVNGIPLTNSYFNLSNNLQAFIQAFQNQYGSQADIYASGSTSDGVSSHVDLHILVPYSSTVLNDITIGNNTYQFTNYQCPRLFGKTKDKNSISLKNQLPTNNQFAINSPFTSQLNNFSVSYDGSFGDPNCPSFSNLDFLIPGSIPSFNSAAAILGSSSSENYSVGGQIGLGINWNPLNKLITIGKKYSHSWDNSKSLTSLIDINGDGLDDLIIKQGNTLFWKKHKVTRTYNSNNEPIITHLFDEPFALISSLNNDIKDFYKSKGESSSWDTEISIGFTGASGFVGWEKSRNKSKTSIYFTDANADGLMDIVKYGTVFFNRIDGNGNPYFEPESLNTENMLIVAEPVTVNPPDDTLETIEPNYDVVKVWEAPANGSIKIDNLIVNNNPNQEAILTIEMQKKEPKCYTLTFPTPFVSQTIYNYRFYNYYSAPYYSKFDVYPFINKCIPSYESSLTNIKINNTTFTAENNLFVAHGDINGVYDLCPSTPVIYPNNYNYCMNGSTNYYTICKDIQSPDFISRAESWYFNLMSNNFPETFNHSVSNMSRFSFFEELALGPSGYYDVPTGYWELANDKGANFQFSSTINNYSTEINMNHKAGVYNNLHYLNIMRDFNTPSSQSNLNVGIITNVSLNGMVFPNTYNLYTVNFFSFKNYFELNNPGSTVTRDTQNNTITINITNSNQLYDNITLSSTDNSGSNSYDFIEIPCGEDKSLIKDENLKNKEDWISYKPTKIELELALNIYNAEGNNLNNGKSDDFCYIISLDNVDDEFNYYAKIFKNSKKFYTIDGEEVKSMKIIDFLNEKLPNNINDIYFKEEKQFEILEKERKTKERQKAQNWLEEYYKNQNREIKNQYNSESHKLINQNTCSQIPSELCLLYGIKLDQNNYTLINSVTNDCDGNILTVNKGDRIYFRTHSIENGNPVVDWNPKVSYVNSTLLAVNDQNGIQPYSSSYSDGFILSQELPTIFPSTNGGTVEITWEPITVNNPTDDVKYEIIQRISNETSNTDTNIFTQTVLANTSNGSVVPSAALNAVSINANTTNASSTTVQFLFRVTSSSNVNWKAYEWKPKMILTTPQPIIGDQGPEGNVTVSETKYPIVNYSIYKPYLCGTNYQTIDIGQINGGSNLSIIPNIANSLFSSSDSGVLHFVVKRDNSFIGRRTITVTGGNVTISPSGSIALGSGTSPNIEVGFYTDDSSRPINDPTNVSLIQKILNSSSIATISNGSSNTSISVSQVNLLHKPIGIFGPMYRQWGQFLYNPEKATNAINVPSLGINLIKEEDLTITQAQAQNMQNLLVTVDGSGNVTGPSSTLSNLAGIDINSADLNALETSIDQVFNNSGFNNFPFMAANPKRNFEEGGYIEKWIGLHDENYASALSSRAATISQSFVFENEGSVLQLSSNTGAFGIDKFSKGEGKSFSGGGGAGFAGASGSLSNGGVSSFLTDYIDLNGDRYPDIVTFDELQYTHKTGGLYTPVGRNNFNGNMSTDTNSSWGVSASGSFSKSGKDTAGADGAMPASNGKLTTGKVVSKSYGDSSGSASISGNYGQGSNTTSRLWADVNGDGLADIILKESNGINIHLNLGSLSFNPNNLYSSFALAEGSSQSFGGGIGYNYANQSFSGGVSLGRSDSDTQNTLIDINGDGLIDRVHSSNDNIDVVFNRGNRFVDNAVQISDSFDFNNNSTSTSASANVGGTYSFIFPLYLLIAVIPLKVVDVNASASAGTSTNRTKKSFMDFDGDGYQDFVEEISSTSVKVYHSRIRRTDMLKSVTNPLGGKFTVDYKVQNIDYNNPHAKWTMTSLVIDDNYDKVNDGKDSYRKDFVYENGKYDRRERDFYGFETVKVIDYALDTDDEPTILYRTSVSKYYNNSYFLNGLLKESYVIQGDDDTKKYSRSINEYEIRELNDSNNEIDFNVATLPNTFDVGGREGRRTAAVLLTKTNSELYELNSSPQLTTQVKMKYDEKGRVVEYTNEGNISNTNDDYTSKIKYHDFGNDIINVPSEIKVLVNNVEKRKRTTDADASTGRITSIKAYLDSSTYSETTMEYNNYGNLTKITYPGFGSSTMSYDYEYDTDFHKYVTSITDSYGYSSSATYDPNFDAILSTIDLAGNQMLYSYDTFGRNTHIIAPKEIEGGKKYTIKFEYYPYFNTLPSGSTGVTVSNFVPVAVTKHFDPQHPDNDIETYTFIDGLARPIQVKKDIYIDKNNNPQAPAFTEALSISGKTKFDEFGRNIEQFHPYFELKNNANKFKLNEYNSNLSSKTEYDELDRPTKSFDPVGSVSSMEYSLDQDINGVMAIKTKSIVDQGSQSIVNENYKDVFGRVISTMNDSPTGALWTNFEYNAISELQSYTDAEAITTSYEYDNFGRKTSVNHPDNGITTFNYDIASNLTSLQTANLANIGQEITYEYYIKRLVAINYPNNPDGSPNISNVNYNYGNSGNQTGRLVYQSDASGEQEFKYGNMGEMVYNRRTVVGPTPTMPVRIFETDFNYDSWNRLLNMRYPDGEKVTFDYDLGGNLNKMTGNVNGQNYEYIQRIDYDYYEQRTYLLYGNKTETFYDYTPELRRLNNLNVKTSNGQDLFNNDYQYDNVGNVLGIKNSAGPTINYMGGNYTHNFKYDKLNRLEFAEGNFNGDMQQASLGNDYYSDYNISMKYNNTHGIENKRQNHFKNDAQFAPNTYDNTYKYEQGTHKLVQIDDANSGLVENFKYDANGNIVAKFDSDGNHRDMLWDESNRLRVLTDNNNSLQHYIYDAAGERILKANSDVQAVFENGTILDPPSVTMNNYISYPSAFLVIDEHGIYSKHYYAGTQRIVSKIGEESPDFFDQNNGLPKQSNGKETQNEEPLDYKKLQATQLADLQLYLDKAKMGKAKFKEYKTYTYEEIEEVLSEGDEERTTQEKMAPPTPVYFYHPDHLGTSTFLTDFNGNAYQFFLNLPFGETMAEQKGTEFYQSPYKFNGKELDADTGLYYYGARYYDPKVSVFISVDPMTEGFVNWNPYIYCLQNPIKMVDPSGLSPEISNDGSKNGPKLRAFFNRLLFGKKADILPNGKLGSRESRATGWAINKSTTNKTNSNEIIQEQVRERVKSIEELVPGFKMEPLTSTSQITTQGIKGVPGAIVSTTEAPPDNQSSVIINGRQIPVTNGRPTNINFDFAKIGSPGVDRDGIRIGNGNGNILPQTDQGRRNLVSIAAAMNQNNSLTVTFQYPTPNGNSNHNQGIMTLYRQSFVQITNILTRNGVTNPNRRIIMTFGTSFGVSIR